MIFTFLSSRSSVEHFGSGSIQKMARKERRRQLEDYSLRKRLGWTRDNVLSVIGIILMAQICSGQYHVCQEGGQYKACFSDPQLILRTHNFTLAVQPESYTCGASKQPYIPLGQVATVVNYCDNSDPATSHLPYNMADSSTSSWWQSITWPLQLYKDTKQFEITVTLNFQKTFIFTNDMQIVFQSGRAKDMILEKSTDFGKNWTVLQYYQKNCQKYTALGAATKVTTADPTVVICSDKYSETSTTFNPGGKVLFPAFQDRQVPFLGDTLSNYAAFYTAMNNSGLNEFLRFTDLRIRLLLPATDSNEQAQNAIDFYKYYYAISDIVIEARCFCNLHGVSCTSVGGTPECVCGHNTEGKDCERCLPLFNDRPWKPGSYLPYPNGQANECTKCECNDHALSCTYNASYGRGVCDNCLHNTTGNHCELCQTGSFPNTSLLLNDTERCIGCDCEINGVVNNDISCLQAATVVLPIGQCTCKPLVTGRQCDTCVPEYYGLLLPQSLGTCQPCACNLDGTEASSKICDLHNGQCPCMSSTTGRQCDQCKDGYYGFPTGNPGKGCTKCTCDPGGASSQVCDKTTSACSCRPRLTGTNCTGVEADHYVPALDHIVLQPEGGSCSIHGDLWTKSNQFDGLVVADCSLASATNVQFSPVTGAFEQLNISWPYTVGIRFSNNETSIIMGGTLEFKVTGDSNADLTNLESRLGVTVTDKTCPLSVNDVTTFANISFQPGIGDAWLSDNNSLSVDLRCQYTVQLDIPSDVSATSPLRIDSVVLLPQPSEVLPAAVPRRTKRAVTSTAQNTYMTCLQQLASMSSREIALNGSSCTGTLWSVSAELFNGAKVCDCDAKGTVPRTVCATFGGQCVCKPGVAGRRCNRCLPGYYNFTVDGCTPCNCEKGGSQHGACDYISGQCPCRTDVASSGQTDTSGSPASRHCNACLANFYGFGRASGCLPCDCKAGSQSLQCAQDGQCPCRPTITGRQCDTCQPSFFSFTATGCQSCNCSQDGSTSIECAQSTGQCMCKENTEGLDCGTCKAGYFNLAGYNQKGCQPCFCFQHGGTCTSASGFVQTSLTMPYNSSWRVASDFLLITDPFTGDQHTSYGQVLKIRLDKNRGNVNMTSSVLVKLEGDGQVLSYNVQTLPMSENNSAVFNVRLFEVHWSNDSNSPVSASVMYRVLADLKRIHVRGVWNGSSLGLQEISLTTATTGTTGVAATFVENCTCSLSDNVSGFSCESCSEGFRRVALENSTRYDSCSACDCMGSNSTATRRCDENTGICQNCIVGRVGDHCERCAPNVDNTTGCTQCMDEYWGLSKDGCQACNCSSPGSTSAVCDKATGQCACASHVTGRTCDKCEDNFHNLTAAGCQECDTCYGLVFEEVKKLRVLRDNLTQTVQQLEKDDVTGSLGLFVSRLQQANSTTQRLLNYLTETDRQEATVVIEIQKFNNSLQSLESTLNDITMVTKPDIERIILQAEQSLGQGNAMKTKTTEIVGAIRAALGPLNTTVTSLLEVATSLSVVESYLVSLSSNSSSGFQGALQTIRELENVTTEANNLAQTALSAVQSALQVHTNNTKEITQLEGLNVRLSSLSTSTIAEGEKVKVKSNDTYNLAIRLQQGLSDLQNFTYDTAGLDSESQQLATTANNLKTQVDQALADSANVSTSLASIGEVSSRLHGDALALSTQATSVKDRATTAETEGAVAKQNSDDIFQRAENMLATMKNFGARAQAVEQTANESLAAVQSVQNVSSDVIAEAASLRTTMAVSQQNSVVAKETAISARKIAEQKLAVMQPVGLKASQLIQRMNQEFTNLTAQSQQPASVNQSIVSPAINTCSLQEVTITGLTTKADSATTVAQQATTGVRRTQARVSRILNIVENIRTADAARIQQLRDEIARSAGSFNETSYALAIGALQSAKDQQDQWLRAAETRRDSLAAEVARMEAIQRSIITRATN